MSWLTEVVRPRIRSWLGQEIRDVPENLWRQCPACQQMIFHKDLDANLKVCPHCGHHMRPAALERLAWTFDDGVFNRIELPKVPSDPIKFRDQKRYTDRLREAREKTGLDDAIVVAHGLVGGQRVVVAAMAFEFMGGSMGSAVGEASSRRRGGRAAGFGVGDLHQFGRRPHARGRGQPDADASHHDCDANGEGGAFAIHHCADRPHDGRRHGLVRHAGRPANRRTWRHDRLRRRNG